MTMPVYLDYNATTPVDPQVAEAIETCLGQHLFGNPSSSHIYGRRAHDAVEKAREQIALLIGARHEEMIFTGCATEANNLAIRGVAAALRDRGRHIITSAIEHPSVTAPFSLLEQQGWDVTVLPVDEFGMVSPESVAAALRPDTVLVSIMHTNNEVGTIQPISAISDITRAKGIVLHTDAAQSMGGVADGMDLGGLLGAHGQRHARGAGCARCAGGHGGGRQDRRHHRPSQGARELLLWHRRRRAQVLQVVAGAGPRGLGGQRQLAGNILFKPQARSNITEVQIF